MFFEITGNFQLVIATKLCIGGKNLIQIKFQKLSQPIQNSDITGNFQMVIEAKPGIGANN